MKTNQEIFDICATHLLSQGMRASIATPCGKPLCRYRGAGGRKCAVGIFILDELYDRRMEGTNVNGLLTRFPKVMEKIGLDHGEHKTLLTRLQIVHDTTEPEDWLRGLHNLCKEFDLDGHVLKDK